MMSTKYRWIKEMNPAKNKDLIKVHKDIEPKLITLADENIKKLGVEEYFNK